MCMQLRQSLSCLSQASLANKTIKTGCSRPTPRTPRASSPSSITRVFTVSMYSHLQHSHTLLGSATAFTDPTRGTDGQATLGCCTLSLRTHHRHRLSCIHATSHIHTSQLHSHPRITAQISKRLPPPAGGRRGRRPIRAPAPKTNNAAAPCTCVRTSIRVAWPRPRIAGRVTAAQCGSGPFGTGAAGGEPPPPPSFKPKASSEASRHPRKSSRRIRACGRPASPPG
mgnify:CR=1 FL=1